jgi:hypothetical protein
MFLFSTKDLESEERVLKPQYPPVMHISSVGCGGEKIAIKRGKDNLTWRHKCDYPDSGEGKITREIKGGIVFNGDSYDGGIIETVFSGKHHATTTYTKLTGKLLGDRAYTVPRRAYTPSDRSDKAKDAVNPVRSIKKLFGL